VLGLERSPVSGRLASIHGLSTLQLLRSSTLPLIFLPEEPSRPAWLLPLSGLIQFRKAHLGCPYTDP